MVAAGGGGSVVQVTDDPGGPVALAVDLGGTNVRAAAVTANGEIIARRQVRTDAHTGLDEILERVAG